MAVEQVTVGSVEIARVTDGAMHGIPSFFFAGVPPDVYEPALGDELSSNGTIEVTFGSFLVRSSGKTILVDTGMGNKRPGSTGGALIENLTRLGVAREDVDIVVNTHLHLDHVGWNCTERNGAYMPTFPKAGYWIAKQEWLFWTDLEIAGEEGPHLASDVLPLANSPQLQLVDSETSITPEVSLLPTPGHTPGHCSLGVASGGERAIILGDVAHHPLHLERLWIAAVDELPRVSRRTKRVLAERLVEERLLVAAGHFSSGSFGHLVLADGRRSWQTL